MPFRPPINPNDPSAAVAQFLGMNAPAAATEVSNAPLPSDYTFSGAVPSRGELSSPFEMDQAARATAADQADRAHVKQIQGWLDQLSGPGAEVGATQQAEKLAQLTAAPEATAAGQLAVEREKNRAAAEQQQTQQAFTRELMGGGGATAGGTGEFTMNIDARGNPTFQQTKTPQQVQAQQHAAQVGLSQIPQTRQILDSATQAGLIGPIASRTNSALVGTGLDALIMHPENARAFNDLKTQLSLIKSNLAYAHGAARGGSSPAMQQRFDALLNINQSPDALRGGLDAAERWLTQYANAKSSAELDAADAALGVSGGAYQRPSGPPSTWATPPTNAELSGAR